MATRRGRLCAHLAGFLPKLVAEEESVGQTQHALPPGGHNGLGQGDHVVDHYMRRQIALADAGTGGLLQRATHLVDGEELGGDAEDVAKLTVLGLTVIYLTSLDPNVFLKLRFADAGIPVGLPSNCYESQCRFGIAS
jgi:hypothetical protein